MRSTARASILQGEKACATRLIIGCDFHTRYHQIAMMGEATGELVERRLEHESGEAHKFYRDLPKQARGRNDIQSASQSVKLGDSFISRFKCRARRREAMPKNQSIEVGPLKETELEEADRIVRLAFGTFLGLPNPLEFMDDRTMMAPRWRSAHVAVLAAREGGRLVGSNVLTRWGSFAFFGPLTVMPEYWDRGVAQRLLERTMAIFDRWGVRHSGLYTFSQSAKHVGLYQKFGYWPRYLTAIMTLAPEAKSKTPALLSALEKNSAQRPSRHAEN